QSHAQFTRDYIPGFPGQAMTRTEEAQEFLDPTRDPIERLPGLATLAALHRDLIRALTREYVGIRQEEHRLFLASMLPEAMRLRALMAAGTLPRDVYLATDCVGVVPYVADVRTLDRLGLTDAAVAHGPFTELRLMA